MSDRTISHSAAQGADAVGISAVRGEPGAPPSNTAPSQDNAQTPHVVHQGVDSLYVSYGGELSPELDAALSHLKVLSSSRDKGEQSLAVCTLGGLPFHIRDKGAGKFKFVLNHPAFNLRVSSASAKSLPLATAQVRSAQLTEHGPQASLQLLDAVVGELAQHGYVSHSLSRVDLCVDFRADWDLLGWPESAWLTRATQTARYSERGRGTGWTIGAGGDISCRLYDKTLEICTRSAHRTDVHQVWRSHGWNGADTVYRIEFQLMRESLRQLGISTLDELQPMLGSVWAYLMQEWLRLVVPRASDAKRCRWPVHPVWEAIGRVAWPGSVMAPVARSRPGYAPSEKHALERLRSALTSFMAIRRLADGGEAMLEMYRLMERGMASRADYAQTTVQSLLFDEAAAKATRAGRPFDSVQRDAEREARIARVACRQRVTHKRTDDHGER